MLPLDLDLDLDHLDLAERDDMTHLSSVDAAMDLAAAPLPVAPVVAEPVTMSEAAEPAIEPAFESAVDPVVEPERAEPEPEPVTVTTAAAVPGPVMAAQPAAPAAPARNRHVGMIATGLVAAGALIFTLLSMRSSASPEPARPSTPPRAAAAPKRSAAPAATASTASAPASSASAPTWSHATDGRWIPAGRKNVALELEAVNKVQVWTRQVRPTLVVRCSAGEMETFVYTASAARMEPEDGDHTVHLTFDGAAERTERWPDSDSHDALFARNGAAFAKELTQARTLHFGFTPHNASPTVATFQVSGLAELLASSARQCGLPQENGRKR